MHVDILTIDGTANAIKMLPFATIVSADFIKDIKGMGVNLAALGVDILAQFSTLILEDIGLYGRSDLLITGDWARDQVFPAHHDAKCCNDSKKLVHFRQLSFLCA
jgi:hypothetical protein